VPSRPPKLTHYVSNYTILYLKLQLSVIVNLFIFIE